MAIQPGVGTTLSVSASLPTTETATAYGALTYSQVGKVESIGAGGRSRQEINFVDLDSGIEEVFGGTMSYGARDIQTGEVVSDTGQQILEAAIDSNSVISVEIERSDGSLRYFKARVFAANDNGYQPNDITRRTYTIRQVSAEVDVAAP